MRIFDFLKKMKLKSEVERSATYDRYLDRIVGEISNEPEVQVYKATFLNDLKGDMPEPQRVDDGKNGTYIWPKYFKKENLWAAPPLSKNSQKALDRAETKIAKLCASRYAKVPEHALNEVVCYLGALNEIENYVVMRTHEYNSVDDYIRQLSANCLYEGMVKSIELKKDSGESSKAM